MKKERIVQAIENKFFGKEAAKTSERKIVFWYDRDNSFTEVIDELFIENVKIHKVDKDYFYTKYLLEVEDPDSNYVIYINTPKPKNEDNWLLDILLYSDEFSADLVSLVMDELGIENRTYCQFFTQNIKFFENQKRLDYIKNIQQKNWNEDDYYLAMLSYIYETKQLDIEAILRNIFIAGLDDDNNKYLTGLKNFGLENIFWEFVKKGFQYQTEKPNLRGLFLTILITYLISTLKVEAPHDWKQYLSKNVNNCVVFIDNWMNHKSDSLFYEDLAADISKDLKINDKIGDWSIDVYKEADAFDVFDKFIIQQIIDLMKNNYEDFEYYLDLINLRKTKHWATNFEDIYNSLGFAIQLARFKKEHLSDFHTDKPEYFIDIYAEEFYKVDYYYRNFYYFFDKIQGSILDELKELVEKIYVNWFLDNISPIWLKSIKDKISNVLEGTWEIKNIRQQKNFYEEIILPLLKQGERDKVFVLISDGLRFEVAKELADSLNSETRGSTDISYLQGVLPSTTKFGMAALLPHETISLEHTGKVLVDGIDITTMDSKKKLLNKYIENSLAVSWNELNALSREDAREALKNKRLIYIFHNTIDAYAEDIKKEVKVFDAVGSAIEEIIKAIKYICNSLNGTRVLVVADHGFLYKRSKIDESEKLKVEESSPIEAGRRYLLSQQKADQDGGVISINMDYLIANQEKYYAIIPNGILRFKTQGGGINYVHGGASLQEIVIPLIDYRHVEKSAAKEKDINRPAKIELMDTYRKVTNNSFKVRFFQVDKITDKIYSIKLKAAFWDLEGTGEKISNEQVCIVDKNSDIADERIINLRFTLKQKRFDKDKDYYLILLDEKTGLEHMKISFKIDILIENLF
ncbi:MAG: BREX-1 system phosphatase PglZ type A [Candidatus Humimicrobiaceae bacterium]